MGPGRTPGSSAASAAKLLLRSARKNHQFQKFSGASTRSTLLEPNESGPHFGELGESGPAVLISRIIAPIFVTSAFPLFSRVVASRTSEYFSLRVQFAVTAS